MQKQVDLKNIQGSIWPRLPRYYESFLFFKIIDEEDVDQFKEHLRKLVYSETDSITTGAECKEYLVEHGGGISEAREKHDIPPEERIKFDAINVAFTGKGVLRLVGDYDELLLRDLLHNKGMYQDLVFEGPDEPGNLKEEYKPPPGYPANNGNWRNDGVFIVATQRKEELDAKIKKLKEYFCVDQPGKASIKITVVKNGQVRNADGKAKKRGDEKNLHGKEHFGFEDQISQPPIKGLDDKPGKDEPREIPPGWILLGHEGDNTRSPEWANDGSYLVFREIEERVMEFNKFTKEQSEKLDGFKDGTGEKLAAHMIGRWKNGSPVALDTEVFTDDTSPHTSKGEHPYANNFEYRQKYANSAEVKCPFAAHTRKMRPRADLYVGKNGDEEVTLETNTVENSNVILRRSITFGPELTEEEEKNKKDIEERGIYFCCYQGDLRNGFNFLVTRWASNRVFASKDIDADPGVDPIVSQASSRQQTKPTFGIFEENDSNKPKSIDLQGIPWIAQKGGEYFFTPSIKALKTTFVDEIE